MMYFFPKWTSSVMCVYVSYYIMKYYSSVQVFLAWFLKLLKSVKQFFSLPLLGID